jgi:hypothetical protein
MTVTMPAATGAGGRASEQYGPSGRPASELRSGAAPDQDWAGLTVISSRSSATSGSLAAISLMRPRRRDARRRASAGSCAPQVRSAPSDVRSDSSNKLEATESGGALTGRRPLIAGGRRDGGGDLNKCP